MSLFEPFQPDSHGTPLKGVSFRPAHPDDAPAIAELDAQRHGSDAETLTPKVRGELESVGDGQPKKRTWVACVEGIVVAYAKCVCFSHPGRRKAKDLPDGWYLLGLVIRPDMRRQGIARGLTSLRMRWLESQNGPIWYFANAKNQASIQLHEEFGFHEVRRNLEIPWVTFEGGVGILFGLPNQKATP